MYSLWLSYQLRIKADKMLVTNPGIPDLAAGTVLLNTFSDKIPHINTFHCKNTPKMYHSNFYYVVYFSIIIESLYYKLSEESKNAASGHIAEMKCSKLVRAG